MRLFYVAGAVAVVLVADAAVLIGVVASRRSGPGAMLRVSEREFESAVISTDKSAAVLHPRYGPEATGFGSRAVEMESSRAAALGVSARPGSSAAKRVFAALEVQPDASAGAGRLRIADLEQDPAALRARYPDRSRYAVVRASCSSVGMIAEPGCFRCPRAFMCRRSTLRLSSDRRGASMSPSATPAKAIAGSAAGKLRNRARA